MSKAAAAATNQIIGKMPISKIKKLVRKDWQAGLVPMIWGPPGVGKSAIIREMAKEAQYRLRSNPYLSARSAFLRNYFDQVMTGRPVHDIRLILMNPTDIKGIPVYDAKGKEALWIQTGSFPMSTEELDRLESRVEANYASFEKFGFQPYAVYPDNHPKAGRLDYSKPDAKGKYPELSPHDLDWIKIPEDQIAGSNSIIHDISEVVAETITLEHRVAQGLKEQFAVIFLDEISIAPKSVQGAALQLVLDRQAGTYKVPKNVDMVCAGNRTEDRVGAGVMTPALSSRMNHLHVKDPTFEDWLPYATENGVSMEVIGFLQFKKALIFDYDPSKMTGSADAPSTFPCPRTWEMASNLIKTGILDDLDEDESMAILGGVVGEGVSSVFHAWYEIYRKLPNADDVLDGKISTVDFKGIASTDPVNADIRAVSLKYAFIFLLMENCLKRDLLRDLATNQKTKKDEIKKFVSRFSNMCKFITNEKKDADWAFLVTLRVLKTLKNENAMPLLAELRKEIPEFEALLKQGNSTGGVGIQMSGGGTSKK